MEQGTVSFEELVGWAGVEFSINETSSRLRLQFLKTAGLIYFDDGVVKLEPALQLWLKGGEDTIVIAIMHSRIKFIGEMLEELQEPKSTEGLREIAANYGLDWEQQQQINNRRGWLESAKLISGSSNKLELLPDGKRLLDRLAPSKPDEGAGTKHRTASTTSKVSGKTRLDQHQVPYSEELSSEILAASTTSSDPSRFERAVRDGFQFMGFVAEHHGGAGKTDVLLTAPLGRNDVYRVAVDAKTTSSGSLGDNQVDWDTLKEHREKHHAKYSLLVAPDPTEKRLLDRAVRHSISVMSAEELAGLCRGHAIAPLSLVDYEYLFQTGGAIDPGKVEEQADHIVRLRNMASTIYRQLPERTDRFGRMSARDVLLSLDEEAEGFSEGEIQDLLDMLSHPLIGAVHDFGKDQGSSSTGRYVLASNRDACRRRIELLAGRIHQVESGERRRKAGHPPS